MQRTVDVLHTGFVTHDVMQLVTSRPDDLTFEPGQGVTLALDEDGWREEGQPFTPTSHRSEPVLEFTIKEYPEHDGLTVRLHGLEAGDGLLVGDSFGTIIDQGAGTFVAGGAGVTPFLAILRHMSPQDLAKSSLHFSNNTPADVICEKELRHVLGDRLHLTCTDRSAPGYDDRRIDGAYLEAAVEDVDGRFYVCGPPAFVEEVRKHLVRLGAGEESIVVEE